jgi:galactokinase
MSIIVTRREQLINRATASFHCAFDREPEMLVAAPGRVNLIGEHTDYNDGFVLPCAIDYETIVAIGTGKGVSIEAVAGDYDNARDSFDPSAGFVRQQAEWKNHLRGVAASMMSRGLTVGGVNLAVVGDVPQGAGLSSSASMSVALAKALSEHLGLHKVDATDYALIAQQSENDFVGCACGIMDQLVSARGKCGTAMLLDCRSLEPSFVRVPDDLVVMVVHSGVKRGLVDSAYNERRNQCELAATHYGVSALRDLDSDRLVRERGDLDDVSYRRARHVVTENARVLAAADALASKDIATLAVLMKQSHQSMRDDFEITVSPIDTLVEMIDNSLGLRGGVRMTGGGFGGCVVALVPVEMLEQVTALVEGSYQTPDGAKPRIIICNPSSGASVL